MTFLESTKPSGKQALPQLYLRRWGGVCLCVLASSNSEGFKGNLLNQSENEIEPPQILKELCLLLRGRNELLFLGNN